MLTTTSNYDTENAKTEKMPCVIIQFNGIADPQFCSCDFGDIDSTYYKLIKNVSYDSAGWTPLDVFLSKATIKFTLIDDASNTVLDLISNNILINDTVSVKLGYDSLDEADFVSLPTFYVKKIDLASNLIDHVFVCEQYDDFDRIFTEPVLTNLPTTFLTADETNSDTTINVNSTTGFLDATSLPSGIRIAAIIIGNEIIIYTGQTANTFTGCARGYRFTTAQNHSSGAEVKQCFVFGTQAVTAGNENDNFAQVLLRILTNNDGSNGVYDSNISNFGYNIDESKIDIEQIEREGYHYHGANVDYNSGNREFFEFFIYQELSGNEVIRQLLEPYHAVFFVGSNSKIQIKVLDAPFMISEDLLNETLTDNNSKLIGHEWYDDGLITEIRYKYGYNPAENKFSYESTNNNASAETAYNSDRKRTVIENNGLIYTNAGDKFHTLDRFFIFYGQMPIKMNFSVISSKWLYEPLDMIKLTSSFIPNYSAGNRTITDTECMVMKKTIQLDQNGFKINYNLFAFNLVSKNSDDYSLYEYTATDDSLEYSTNKTATVEAEDANRTFASAIATYGNGYAQLEIVVPNGSDTEQYIDIALCYVDSAPSFLAYTTTRIRYNSSWNKTITVWVPILCGYDAATTLKYIKVDWFNRSTSTGGDLPTIMISKILQLRADYRI